MYLRGSPVDCKPVGRGDDAVGNPDRAQICKFELFELILLLKVDNTAPCRAISRQQHLSQKYYPSDHNDNVISHMFITVNVNNANTTITNTTTNDNDDNKHDI